MLIDSLLFVTLLIQLLTLASLFRRRSIFNRPYSLVVLAVLSMAFFARSVDSPRIAFAAIALSFLTVVLPSILEVWMRIAAGRQRTGLVVRLAKIRAFLMPGAGLEQQTRALHALELQDSAGCDAALLYLKKCARELDEPYALALVHEQILSNLVALERYDEAVAHADRWFDLQQITGRPPLAAVVVRMLCETDRLQTAVEIVQRMEQASASDPRLVVWADQLALIVLSYVGYSASVHAAGEEVPANRFALGPGSVAFLRGIAEREAGNYQAARTWLETSKSLVSKSERRIAELAGHKLETLNDDENPGARELPVELRTQLDEIARRLAWRVAKLPEPVHTSIAPASLAAMVFSVVLFAVVAGSSYQTQSLLQLGLLSPGHWKLGQFFRVATTPWLHANLQGLLFDVYVIALAGRILERRYGTTRFLLLVLVAPALALSLASLAAPSESGAGALQVQTIVLLCAGLANLLAQSQQTRSEPVRRSQRSLMFIFAMILASNALAACVLGWTLAGSGAIAAASAALFGYLWARFCGQRLSPPFETGLKIVAAFAVAIVLVGFGASLRQRRPLDYLLETARTCSQGELKVVLPESFRPVPETQDGALQPMVGDFGDALAFQSIGARVEFGVLPVPQDPNRLAVMSALGDFADSFSVTEVSEELAEPFRSLTIAAPSQWIVRDLRRDGQVVARVVERRIEAGGRSAAAFLLSTPAQALDQQAVVYAKLLGEAQLIAADEVVARCDGSRPESDD